MIELGKETERVILVGVSLTEQEDTRKSLDELKELASTAGAETVGTVIRAGIRYTRGLTWEKER